MSKTRLGAKPAVSISLGGIYFLATTRLMPLHVGKGRNIRSAISSIIEYIANPDKTEPNSLIKSWYCGASTADAEFNYAYKQYLRNTGQEQKKNDVIAYHIRQSFAPGEVTPAQATEIGVKLVEKFTHGKHAYIVCTHTDKAHIHNHIIFSSVALDEKSKFKNFWGSTKAIRRISDTLCVQEGLSIVENPKRHGLTYDKWLGDKRKPSHRELLRYSIDEALTHSPSSFTELLNLLEEAGYTVKSGKVPSLRLDGQQRFIRKDTLGEAYTPEALKAVISGEKTHTPAKRKTSAVDKFSGSLLIDIEAKLHAGKGPGYERWAKKFNLKQMSQTLIFLQENGLTYRAELNAKAAEASQRFQSLSKKIKTAEARMAEIKVMQQHIINYSKTRETYVGYRKAGYSKKFLADHESEIILHKAAKKFFDEQQITKLPTVKSLQEEYAKLLSAKKSAYADYREAKEEHRSLSLAKANVDRILGEEPEQSTPEKENEKTI